MAGRRVLALVVLVLWVTFGPVAMAFGGCLLMGAMCDGPCGTSSHATFAPAPSTAPRPIAYLDPPLQGRLPDNTLSAADPPPKPSAFTS
jgi:hypothetical protein